MFYVHMASANWDIGCTDSAVRFWIETLDDNSSTVNECLSITCMS